jgi:hypothetical protein
MNQIETLRVQSIIAVLQSFPKSTREIEIELGEYPSQCPEELLRLLNIMRRQGIIEGKPDLEKGGWLWGVKK